MRCHHTWRSLGVSAQELRLAHTLPTGQAFGWRAVETDGAVEWRGAVGDAAVALREAPGTLEAEWRCAAGREREVGDRLHDYFQLDTPLSPLYELWCQRDSSASKRLRRVAEALPGVRVLRQDPTECLIAFICSSNNNIPRITLMLDRLKRRTGARLELPGTDDDIYAFPTFQDIAEQVSEQDLRDLGFGYRAPYVVATANAARDVDFAALRLSRDYEATRAALMAFRGVGPKVADCVALFCLDHADAVPVDTHVWRLARRDYDVGGRLLAAEERSLTAKLYAKVGDTFRETFGDHAGWAHSLLFAAELPAFAPKLPEDLVADMRRFRDDEKKAAKLHKEESTPATPTTPRDFGDDSSGGNKRRKRRPRTKEPDEEDDS